jgi:hypothetical protein
VEKSSLEGDVRGHPVGNDAHELPSVTGPAQGLDVADVVRASSSQRDDVISLQPDFRSAASQAPVSIPFTKHFELFGGKTPQAGVFRGSPFTAVVGLGVANFLGIILSPLLTASYNLMLMAFVLFPTAARYHLRVLSSPPFLVFVNLFFVLFLILSARFDPVG